MQPGWHPEDEFLLVSCASGTSGASGAAAGVGVGADAATLPLFTFLGVYCIEWGDVVPVRLSVSRPQCADLPVSGWSMVGKRDRVRLRRDTRQICSHPTPREPPKMPSESTLANACCADRDGPRVLVVNLRNQTLEAADETTQLANYDRMHRAMPDVPVDANVQVKLCA